jgi:hypothetical protein
MGGLIKFFTSLISGVFGFVGGLVGGNKGGYYMDAGPAEAASPAAVAPRRPRRVQRRPVALRSRKP